MGSDILYNVGWYVQTRTTSQTARVSIQILRRHVTIRYPGLQANMLIVILVIHQSKKPGLDGAWKKRQSNLASFLVFVLT